MDINRKELSDIKDVLKDSPRGMTVTEISKSVGMNRHSVAKYLEVLVAAGHVDMKSFGPSKVYYLSQRVPLSAMLSFSSDLIVIIDKDLLIRNANDKFLETMGLTREKAINRNVENFLKPVTIASAIMSHIHEALNGKDLTMDTSYLNGPDEVYYTVKFIPTVFDDGDKGVTLIMTDVTGHRRIEKAIRDSERKFRDMISQSTEGITLCDENGVIIEYNESMAKLTGSPKEDVIGKHVWEIPFFIIGYDYLTGRSTDTLEEYVKIFLKTGASPIKNNYNNFDVPWQDGTTVSVQTNIFPIKTANGYMLAAIIRDVTDQKKAEKAILESEEKFRNLAETTTSGILILQDDRIVYANRGAADITGYPVKELLNKKMNDFLHPDYEWVIDEYRRNNNNSSIAKKINAPSTAFKIIKKNREERWIDGSIGMMTLNGRPALIKTFFDITARKQMEEELKQEHAELETRVKERTVELEGLNAALTAEVEQRRRSEDAARKSTEKYQNLVENINDIAWQEDANGKFTYVSPRIEEMLGYKPVEVLGRTMLDFMDPGESNKLEDIFWQLFREPKNYKFYEINMRHKDGHRVVFQTNGTPCYDEKGMLRGYQGVARDITEKKHTEEALRKSEERFRSLVENINDIAWEMDSQARFTYVSPKIKDILGYGPEHYLGKVIVEFMPAEDLQKFSDGFGRIYARPRPYNLENLRMFHKDGSIHSMEVNGMPFYDNKGTFCGFHGVTRDVTQRKSMDEIVDIMTYSMTHPDVAAFRVSADATVSNANDAAGRLLGYAIQELNAISMSNIHPVYSEATWREHWESLKQHRYEKSTTSYLTKDGRAIPVEVTENYAVFNGSGYGFFFIRPTA